VSVVSRVEGSCYRADRGAAFPALCLRRLARKSFARELDKSGDIIREKNACGFSLSLSLSLSPSEEILLEDASPALNRAKSDSRPLWEIHARWRRSICKRNMLLEAYFCLISSLVLLPLARNILSMTEDFSQGRYAIARHERVYFHFPAFCA